MITNRLKCIHHPDSCAHCQTGTKWRRHLIEVRVSVLHGNILESLQRFQQCSGVEVTEVEIVDDVDEQIESCDRHLPILDGTPSETMRSIKEACDIRASHTSYDFTGNCDGSSDDVLTILEWQQTQVWSSWTLERLKLLDFQRNANLYFKRSNESCSTQRLKSMWKLVER